MTTEQPIRWGIIGPGTIAKTFADGIAHSRTGRLEAIATRNPDKPGLAEAFAGARIIHGYDALLSDPDIDAVYIATPHTGHAEWAIKAIRAGKNVLVEKPIALSAYDADAIFHEARKAGVFAGEAYMYRLHPQTAKLLELVKSRAVGDIRIIRSSFGFNMGSFRADHRLFANEMAGGGILDVGGYPVSMVRLIAGAVDGKPFAEPEKVAGAAHLGQSGVDEWASAVLKFSNGIVAEVSCSIMAGQDNVLRIIGSEGRIDAPRLHHALGIAATQAAGLWQLVDDDAHESKSLHPAFAVRNGMTAAFAARAGLPGARAFFTGQRGMYAALAGDGPSAALDGALEAPERLHTTTIKAWPACAMLFTPLDATRALIEEHRIGAADVQAMEIEIFPHALKIAGVQWPAKPAEASFCLRYVLAVLLEKGGVLDIADTEAPDLGNPRLRALAARMQVLPNEEFQQAFPQRRPSRVTIRLRDGRQISAYRDLRRGDPEDPYTWQGLQQRMRTFVPAMDDAQAALLATWCEGFTDAAQDALPCAPAGGLFGAT